MYVCRVICDCDCDGDEMQSSSALRVCVRACVCADVPNRSVFHPFVRLACPEINQSISLLDDDSPPSLAAD